MTLSIESETKRAGLPLRRNRRMSRLQRLWRRPTFGIAVHLVALVLVAIFAPVLAPHDPIAPNLGSPIAPFSAEHPPATDDLGRDVPASLGARPTIVARSSRWQRRGACWGCRKG